MLAMMMNTPFTVTEGSLPRTCSRCKMAKEAIEFSSVLSKHWRKTLAVCLAVLASTSPASVSVLVVAGALVFVFAFVGACVFAVVIVHALACVLLTDYAAKQSLRWSWQLCCDV